MAEIKTRKMNFPKVIAGIILGYVGETSCSTMLYNPEVKFTNNVLLSTNGKYICVTYTKPDQTILWKRVTGEWIHCYTLNYEAVPIYVYSCGKAKLLCRPNRILILDRSGRVLKENIISLPFVCGHKRYIVSNYNIVHKEVGETKILSSYNNNYINTCQKNVVAIRNDNDVVVYSLQNRSTRHIKFGIVPGPSALTFTDKFLIAFNGNIILFSIENEYTEMFKMELDIPMTVTLCESFDNRIIFGNTNHGLYEKYLNDINVSEKLPVNNLFTKISVNKNMIAITNPGGLVYMYTQGNLKGPMYKLLSNDKPTTVRVY